jgi:hypothetical protein
LKKIQKTLISLKKQNSLSVITSLESCFENPTFMSFPRKREFMKRLKGFLRLSRTPIRDPQE